MKQDQHAENVGFRGLADKVPAILWITDKQGSCVFLNKRWQEITGQPEDESLGIGWTKKIHHEDADAVTRIFMDANAAAVPLKLLYRLQQKDDSYRWVIDQAEPRFDKAGNFDGYIGTVSDIHDQIVANKKIEDTEELFRIALESANMGTFDYYPQTGELHWSAETKAFFGLPPDAIPDASIYKKAIYPADLQQAWKYPAILLAARMASMKMNTASSASPTERRDG